MEKNHKAPWRVPGDKKVGDEVTVQFGKGKKSRLYQGSSDELIINPFQKEAEKKKQKKGKKELIRPRYKGKILSIKGKIVEIKLELTHEDGTPRRSKIIYRKIENEKRVSL